MVSRGRALSNRAWHGLTLGAQRAAFQALFTITVMPAGRGFRPDVRQRVTLGPP